MSLILYSRISADRQLQATSSGKCGFRPHPGEAAGERGRLAEAPPWAKPVIYCGRTAS